MKSNDVAEKIRFASYGRTWMILLRGKRGMAIDQWLVRWCGFSLVGMQYALASGKPYVPVLLLTTIGVKSGELRTVALPYLEWNGRYVVAGSNAGGATDPRWVGNIRGDAHCWLRIRRRNMAALAHVASGEERKDLFEFVTRHRPNVARYQEQADIHGRDIPLVVLSPSGMKSLSQYEVLHDHRTTKGHIQGRSRMNTRR